MQKYQNDEFTEYELINAIFELFEQVSQMQAQLLDASLGLMAGGPAQTHVGTGGGGHHLICLGARGRMIII